MQMIRPTIYALASGRPPVAIALVRISGPAAVSVGKALCVKELAPRVATHVMLRSGGQAIDDAVAIWFPGPRSATGEDVLELHVHGGRAVLATLFAALGRIDGLRPAEPGEFTRRAFENGKLDLTAAEGLDDLIHADTEQQRRQALRQLKGFLGGRAEQWRRRLIEAIALVEASIDFSDEGDVPDSLMRPALEQVAALRAEIAGVLTSSAHSERLRDGLVVAIAGPPNAGKSTLFNRLAQREAAIVSPHAGTTRDVIEVHLDLGGYPVTLLDTAGIRASSDPVEQEGIRRAEARAAAADLVLWLSDGSGAEMPANNGTQVWQVLNKADLRPAGARDDAGFAISAARGDGIEALVGALVRFAEATFGAGEAAVISRVRHRTLLEDCRNALDRAVAAEAHGVELVAEELRSAAAALGRLTGRVDVEDILEVIFRDFCIGK